MTRGERMDYQAMPPLSEEEYGALKADIAQRGVLVPVVEDGEGNVIDGHHRRRAWEELKALGFDLPDLPRDVRRGLSEQQKRDLSVSLNLQRRHLNRAQRKEVIAALLRRTPERSDRWLAEIAGCDHKTVGSVRCDLEVRGELPQPDKLLGKDGKSYVRLESGRYEDEDRRRDRERRVETHHNVRRAIQETPDRTDEQIAEEFDTTTEFVADQRDDLQEKGPKLRDVLFTPETASRFAHHSRTAEEKREDARERRERTKARKDAGELKTEDSRKAVERLVELDRVLHLGHSNENRRITPEEAAEGYARFWRHVRIGVLAQADLEAVARVAAWMEKFVPAFASQVDEMEERR